MGDVPHCLWVRLALLLSTFPTRSWWTADSLRGWNMEPTGMGWGCCPGKGKRLEVAEKGECVCLRFIAALHLVCPVFVNGCILWALDTYLTQGFIARGHEWLQGPWSMCAASSPTANPIPSPPATLASLDTLPTLLPWPFSWSLRLLILTDLHPGKPLSPGQTEAIDHPAFLWNVLLQHSN